MSRQDWRAPTSAEVAYRRAGGRRAYNAARSLQRRVRQARVARLRLKLGDWRGVQRVIACRLQVCESTVSRDCRAMDGEFQASWPRLGENICPLCHQPGYRGERERQPWVPSLSRLLDELDAEENRARASAEATVAALQARLAERVDA